MIVGYQVNSVKTKAVFLKKELLYALPKWVSPQTLQQNKPNQHKLFYRDLKTRGPGAQ